MTDIDHTVWQLVQNVVKEQLDKEVHEKDIIEYVLKITHGMVDYNGIIREINRQKREVTNDE